MVSFCKVVSKKRGANANTRGDNAVGLSYGQGAEYKSSKPQIVNPGYMSQTGAIAQFTSANKLTPDGNSATKQQRVNSVPNFTSSFTYNGTTYPLHDGWDRSKEGR
jgi:hypothetical protein